MRLHGTTRVGILALCVGIVVFVSVYYWVNTRTLVPLDIPVTLAPGHIRTGDFKINVEAYLSVQIRFPNCSADTNEHEHLRTRRLTSVGGQAVSAPGSMGATNGEITEGPYLGTFLSKPGHYNLDIEVLSPTRFLDFCAPRLQVEASYHDFNEWDGVRDFSLCFTAFCELLGMSMLFVFATTHFRRESLEEVRLRIFNTDAPIGLLPAAELKSGRTFPWLLIFGITGVTAGALLFAGAMHWYDAGDFDFLDDLNAKLQIVSLFSAGAGLASLVGYRFAWLRRQPRGFLLSPSFQEHKPAWGITGLRLRRFPARGGWAVNPVKNLPTIALVCSLTWFVWLVPTWFIFARGQHTSHGLLVSIPRIGVPVSASPAGLMAPLVRIDSMDRVYLNYKQTTWEELPAGLKEELRGLPAPVVYLDAANDMLFMEVAKALDIIQGLSAKAILMTPGSKAEK
jgi:biopolymer transport protein ExbD